MSRRKSATADVYQENYGRKDAAAEARVKEVFSAKPIDIPTRFEAYEKDSYDSMMQKINAVDESSGMKRQVFISFLEKVYKRSK